MNIKIKSFLQKHAFVLIFVPLNILIGLSLSWLSSVIFNTSGALFFPFNSSILPFHRIQISTTLSFWLIPIVAYILASLIYLIIINKDRRKIIINFWLLMMIIPLFHVYYWFDSYLPWSYIFGSQGLVLPDLVNTGVVFLILFMILSTTELFCLLLEIPLYFLYSHKRKIPFDFSARGIGLAALITVSTGMVHFLLSGSVFL